MKIRDLLLPTEENNHSPHILQKTAMVAMFGMVLLSFTMSNLQALLWQTSDWLVGSVLPAVIVDLTNDERDKLEVKSLSRNTVLDQAAQLKAEDMAKEQYFSHFSPKGVSPWFWFKEVSYDFVHAGENLAIHFNDSSAVIDAWMDSPLHKENIINGDFTEIGIGTARGKYEGFDTVYVVQLFGTPAVGAPPVQILPKTLLPAEVEVVEEIKAEPISKLAVTDVVVEEPALAENEDVLGEQYQLVEIKEENKVQNNSEVENPVDKNESDLVYFVSSVPTKEAEIITEREMKPESALYSYMATSSGLVPLQINTNNEIRGDYSLAIGSVATKPNMLLQMTYSALGLLVIILLFSSLIIGVYRGQPQRVAYGVFLLIIMSGLFYVHNTLSTEVVIASEIPTEEIGS